MSSRKTFPTVEQYVLWMVAKYPTILIGRDMDETRLNVADQLLNTNGNGIRDDDEFVAELEMCKREATQAVTERGRDYIANGVFQCLVIPERFRGVDLAKLPHADMIDYISLVGTLDSEKLTSDEVAQFVASNPGLIPMQVERRRRRPYPCFNQRFSPLSGFISTYITLDDDWIQFAVEFYENCLERFIADEEDYAYRWPHLNSADNDRERAEWAERLIKFDSHEEASAAFGAKYNGDIDAFLIRRWQAFREKSIAFIRRTLNVLRTRNSAGVDLSNWRLRNEANETAARSDTRCNR